MVLHPRFRLFCSVTAFAVMLAMLVLQAVAASGDLHHCLHDHSDEPEHQCIVTLMHSGGYDSELPDILPVDVVSIPPDVPLNVLPSLDLLPPYPSDGLLARAPSRGP